MTEQPNPFDFAEKALHQISNQADGCHVCAAMRLVDFATMVLVCNGYDKQDLQDLFEEALDFQLEIHAELEKEELEAEKERARIQ